MFLLPRHADRRACRASRHSPGAGDPAAGESSYGRSGGRRRGWRPVGRSSTPCTHPAAPCGTRSDALATCRRDALRRHRGCRPRVWKPGVNSTLKAAELLPAGVRVEFLLLFQAVPGGWPLAHSGGWQVGLPWDGCGGKLEHQNHGGEAGEELKKGGEALDFCDAPGPASPAAFLGTTVAFWGGKRIPRGHGSEGSAGSGTPAHPQGAEGGRAAERETGPWCRAGTGGAAGHPQGTGEPGCIPGRPPINSKTPRGSCGGGRDQGLASAEGPGCPALWVPWDPRQAEPRGTWAWVG